MKKFIVIILLGFFVATIPTAPLTTIQAGPFEDYLDCAEACIDAYDQWTLRRSACAADCYVELLASPVKMVVEAL